MSFMHVLDTYFSFLEVSDFLLSPYTTSIFVSKFLRFYFYFLYSLPVFGVLFFKSIVLFQVFLESSNYIWDGLYEERNFIS